MKQHPKEIQHRLAFEVTKFVHGEEAAENARQDVPTIAFARPGLARLQGQALIDVLVRFNLASSKSEARRLIEQGGVKLNGQKIADPKAQISKKDFSAGSIATLTVGKRKIVKLILEQ